MKRLVSVIALIFSIAAAFGQDTISVKTFNYNSTTRDTVVDFPSGNDSYSKILMLYNMRCKDNLVSDGNNRNRGCGEWDYSCNTYITDSTKIDSLLTTTGEYTIPGFSGTDFPYSSTPAYNYHRRQYINTTVDSSFNSLEVHFGKGLATTDILNLREPSDNFGRSQILMTAAELTTAGLTPGPINALYFNNTTVGHPTDQCLIRMKHVGQDSILYEAFELSGFTTVYSNNHQFVIDTNKFVFHTPFVWDGISSLLIDFSFQSKITGISPPIIKADATAYPQFVQASTPNAMYLDGESYLSVNGYKGVMGSANRTVEAWVKTSTTHGEICSWGRNAAGEKWVFRVNDAGQLRVEVNGGYIIGTTTLIDDKWHHVAAVLNGSQVNDITLYVDGIKETISSISSRSINTTPDIDVRISRGVNNRYFKGLIDNVRIWNTALSDQDIPKVMHSSLEDLSTANLVFNFDFKSVSNFSTQDKTGTYNATILGAYHLVRDRNYAINRDFTLSNTRPMVTLVSGDYFLTTDTTYALDSVEQGALTIVRHAIDRQYRTIYSDNIAPIDTIYGWDAAGAHQYYDEEGTVYQQTAITADASITQTTLSYMRRWPSSFEIMSFVTPYGIGLNLGAEGKTWTFDVTDFAPVLRGSKRLFMSRGGQFQEEMDIQFLFIKGTPGREVLDIRQIWPTSQYSPNYTNIMDNTVYFPPVLCPTKPDAKGFKVRSAITGHGQEGEFIPRTHFIEVGDTTYSRTVWKECADNPVYPQGGTWIYDRAGWCPGMATDVAEYDLTGRFNGGDSIYLDYGVTAGSGDSRYIVNNQIVEYGDYNFALDADFIDIMEPSNKVEYARDNPMCINPKALIKNNGSTLMSTITIDYWVNDKNNKRTFTWPCHLYPGQTETVYFPIDNSVWTSAIEGSSVFSAEIVAVNGESDEYAPNNIYHSSFEFPNVYPHHFYLFYRPNNASHETSIRVVDEWGNVKYEKTAGSLNNGQLYRDTLFLGLGCYQLEVSDSDDDGISFWANQDGGGFFRIVGIGTGTLLNMDPDFGKRSTVNFTVVHKVDVPEYQMDLGLKCYPNPTSNEVIIEGNDLKNARIEIMNSLGQNIEVPMLFDGNHYTLNLEQHVTGVYFVRVVVDGRTWTTKVTKL